MESYPNADDPQNPNNQPAVSKELELRPVNYPEFAEVEEADPTTPIEEEQWNQIANWVLTLPRTGDLGIQRQFGLDKVTATAVFEELQARGYVTKISIPTPGKGAVRGGGYDVERFGGYMVLVNPDGSSRCPAVPAAPARKVEYRPPASHQAPSAQRFLGRASMLGKLAQESTDYADLNRHRIAGARDIVGGHRRERRQDAPNVLDRQYSEIFNPQLGLVDPATRRVTVTSWMKQTGAKAWERTVPPLEIIDPNAELNDGLSPAEREVDAEIALMQSAAADNGDRLMTDAAIKTALLKKYHPDREDGGDLEKTQRVSIKLMREMEYGEPAPEPSKFSVDAYVDAANEEARQAAEAEAAAAAQADAESSQQVEVEDERINDPAVQWTLRYIATGNKGKALPRLSKESLVGAFLRREMPLAGSEVAYQFLIDRGVIGVNKQVDTAALAELLKKSKS